MDLCPYCGKPIIKNAYACKHCGEWLKDISDYLSEKGSVYAHTNSMEITDTDTSKFKPTKKKEINCIFCGYTASPEENEVKEKVFICKHCGKKNVFTNGNSDFFSNNVSIGWGWVVLTGYFAFAIQSYLNMLDDTLQELVTFVLSLGFLLTVYFIIRSFILKERYEKKKYIGNIFDASIISGSVSTAGVVLFVFIFHFVYPFTGLQSDKKETDNRIEFYKSKIDDLVQKQNDIYSIISKQPESKKAAKENVTQIEEYIRLKNDEKKYSDSIYMVLGESSYYNENGENKRKIKEAGLLMNKIITYKIMSAQNLKNYYIYGEKNSIKTVNELNKEIESLSESYSKNFKDILAAE